MEHDRRTIGAQQPSTVRIPVERVGRNAQHFTAAQHRGRRPLTERDQAVLEQLHHAIPTRPAAIERQQRIRKTTVQSVLSKLSQRGLATRTTGGWVRT